MNLRAKPQTTLTSRQFNQDTASAKRSAREGPVFITDRGKPTHVLMTKEEYDRLRLHDPRQPEPRSVAQRLAHPASAHLDFVAPSLGELFRSDQID